MSSVLCFGKRRVVILSYCMHRPWRSWNRVGRLRRSTILNHHIINQNEQLSNIFHTSLTSGFSSRENNETSRKNPDLSSKHWGPYLVSGIHKLEESSRFHGYSTLRWGTFIIVSILSGIYIFRDELRDNVADEVADVASRSMADENVILKAYSMTKGVLERLVKEPETISLVSEFVSTVLLRENVRKTAVEFATSIIDHPETQAKLQEITKNTIHSLLNDQDTKLLLLDFIRSLIEDQQTKDTCNKFLFSLTKDDDIQEIMTAFFKTILTSPTLQMEATTLGLQVTNKVVNDKDIQKETGEALWNAVKYGMIPSWFHGGK